MFFRSLLLLLGLASTFAAVGGVSDDDLHKALQDPSIGNYLAYGQFKMGRYRQARTLWEALDERRDNGDAAFNLGILYEDGLGVEKNLDRALSYYHRAHTNGSRKASFRLGVLYLYGTDGLQADRVQGRRYLSEAARRGDNSAMQHLEKEGGDSADDPLVAADRAMARGQTDEAVSLLKASANAGNAHAQTRLAWHYEAGRGVPRQIDEAARWFGEAARQGDGEAMYALSVMHRSGQGRPRSRQEADRWLRKAAEAGYPLAREALAAPP